MTPREPSARLRPYRPQPFGRYTLMLPLPSGGMGELFLARLEGAQGFEKLCVVKKILPHLAKDKDFLARFAHEARVLGKLSHGSIVQVLDMGVQSDEPYLALEYVDGKDLRKVASRMRDRRVPMPVTVCLYVMSRVLDALAYAHRKRDDDEQEMGLVHRDISPQNILISYEGEVKVIDFGLAKSSLDGAETHPSIILGKFLYMSPEQARNQNVDRRSDLYSVGLCLYELLRGGNPFDDCPPGELISRVTHPRIPPLHEVEPLCPPAVASVVMRALEVDPSNRFASAEEFRSRLLGCLLDIDPSAGPESVTRFMRETFATEYQQERHLLSSFREARAGRGVFAGASALFTETAVFTLDGNRISSAPSSAPTPATALAPIPDLPEGPRFAAAPLSFAPTPRTTTGPAVFALPSIVVDPAVAVAGAPASEATALIDPEALRLLAASSPGPELDPVTQPRAPLPEDLARLTPRSLEVPWVTSPPLAEASPDALTPRQSEPLTTRLAPLPLEVPPEALPPDNEPRTSFLAAMPLELSPEPLTDGRDRSETEEEVPASAGPRPWKVLAVAALALLLGGVLGLRAWLRREATPAAPPPPVAAVPVAAAAPPPAPPPPRALAPDSPAAKEYARTRLAHAIVKRRVGCDALKDLCPRFEALTAEYGLLPQQPEKVDAFVASARTLRLELEARGKK